jgi:hypothetical protein
MQTALQFYGDAPAEAFTLLPKLRAWMDALPDRPGKSGEDALWSCHAIVRAAKAAFCLDDWHVVDGWFGRQGNDHSWLAHYSERGHFILDLYPVASAGGPLLIDGGCYGSPWGKLFDEDKSRYVSRVAKFNREAAELASAA